MSRIVFMPKVERYEVPTSGSYKLTPYKVKNKFLQKCYDKMFNFLVAKEFVTTKSIQKVDIQMERHEIDLNKLDRQILMNQMAIEAIYQNRIDTIVCGADVMREIMNGDPNNIGQVEFQMTQASIYERIRYSGLNIILVPWFEGFLLLEKERDSNDY